MTRAPILAMPDFSQPFVIETDASGYGLGAVLLQGMHPIAYFSKVLGVRARAKPIYEEELMAIVFAIGKWRHYLLGRQFTVRTDQKSLKFLLKQREVGHAYQKWVSKLLGYTFDIHYKPGPANRVADALSRQQPPEVECAAMVTSCGVSWEFVKSFIDQDDGLQKLISQLTQGDSVPKWFSMENGVLRYKGRVVIPSKSELTARLLREYHDSPVGGHAGDLKTYQRLAAEWYWLGMRKDVAGYVKRFHVCQQNKASTLSPLGLLQPLPIPDKVWEDVSMDFIEGLPKSVGWDSFLVVVDRLTKYEHFIPLKHPYTAQEVAQSFMKEVVRLHGIPSSIVSDRDKIFLSIFWSELFKLQGTHLRRSTAYHPETDGQTEVLNKGVESYLRCFVNGKPRSWASWLPWAEYCYNTAFHTATNCTPFKALYGRDPPPPI